MAAPTPDGPAPEPRKRRAARSARPTSPDEVSAYGRLREIHDRSYMVRAVVKAWKDQQTQDRALRERYAHWLIKALAVQAILVNAAFFLAGLKLLAVDEWTARTFILGAFGEIAALVLFVVKYLFTPPDDAILKYLPARDPQQRTRRSRGV